MRKAEIARRIAEETGLTSAKAEEVVGAVPDERRTLWSRVKRSFYADSGRLKCGTNAPELAAIRRRVNRRLLQPDGSSALNLDKYLKQLRTSPCLSSSRLTSELQPHLIYRHSIVLFGLECSSGVCSKEANIITSYGEG